MGAFCLTVHAAYRCRSTGACCTAGWPIPIEPDRVAVLRSRRLFPHTLPPSSGLSGAAAVVVPTTAAGACTFFDAGGDRLCRIQRDAGAALMPLSCRNFPRVAVTDPRGTFITLSHYCPTAARLLLDAGDLAIVEAPAALSLDGEVEGLDATSVMPPLLRPGMLMDWDSYSAWERQVVAVMNDRCSSARRALAVVRDATSALQTWRPGGESLAATVVRAFADAGARHRSSSAELATLEHPCRAFLAAHAFASWAAHGEAGLPAVVQSLEAAHALVSGALDDERAFVAAVRHADLRLRHHRDDGGRLSAR